jgi:hypothetical protein
MTTICRHIKINGERCGCPALRDHAFCYFHRYLAQRHAKPAPEVPTIIHPIGGGEPQIIPPQPTLDLPPLEDRESIQLATSMIVGALARNSLDTKRAATLLYGLQVASANARNLKHSPAMDYLVTETTLTPAGDEIAPDEDPEGEIFYKELLQSLTEGEDEDEEEEDRSESEEAA